jgi:predicted flap endonuclease-1-like 5' DNA nuclease
MIETTSQTIIYDIILILTIGILIYIIKKSTSKIDNSCQDIPPSDNPLHIDNKNRDTISTSINEDSATKPMLLTEPKDGRKDNLQLIKGVGKVLEKVLNDMGVFHFDQIANWTEDEIKWVYKSIAFPGRIKRENWVEQAKLLASGKTTEFAQRVQKGEVSTSEKS